MKTKRRHFLKLSAMGAVLMPIAACQTQQDNSNSKREILTNIPRSVDSGQPLVISTWRHGLAANMAAWDVLQKGGRPVEAVEAGVKISEADPAVSSVGYGGAPDRDGRVSLDACIVDENDNCGAVAGLEFIKHPISVARKVMEETPHVLLVGEGALEFALAQGFPKENLLTESAEKAWKEWLKEAKYAPIINVENHDTIGLLALDSKGQLAGACTTSGLAYKMRGRIGDSPIFGAGLFVDSEVGGATATGLGEAMIKTAACHTIVEMMRQGRSPEEACREAVERITRKYKDYKNMQAGFIAVHKNGSYGAFALQPGFEYAIHTLAGNQLIEAPSLLS
jgi:isoaspartyl peptidase/L-asparaginase-like protein (Ntn-hydrolase superfamily)